MPLLRRHLTAWPLLGLLPSGAQALVDERSERAREHAYHADARTVDPKRHPQYRPDQSCASCSLYQGQAQEAAGGCALFPKEQVAAKAWCKAWTDMG